MVKENDGAQENAPENHENRRVIGINIMQNAEKQENQAEIEASGDAVLISLAIHDLADAIRAHARAMSVGEEPEKAQPRDLDGNPLGGHL